MSRGGAREGAGRKAGGHNRKTMDLLAKARQFGITPLDVMLGNMVHFHKAGDRQAAQKCAAEAAPYLHAKLSSIEAKVDQHIAVDDLDDVRAELVAELARRRAARGADTSPQETKPPTTH